MSGKIIPLLLCLLLVFSLSGCGNKGPLTLPEKEKKTKQVS
ncbi:MAG: lipoprotein [Gammaproteobacteria bacterium]|nr:lipoprotein [Gammaproteobacteria bacterium]